MIKVFIQNGVVIEVARVDPFSIFNPAYASQFIDAPDDVQPGWLYDGESFTAPPVPDPVIVVPQSITMRQARLALLQVNLLDDVDAAIASIPDANERKAAEIEWNYANTVERQSAFVQQMAVGLDMSEEQMDQLFITAATL